MKKTLTILAAITAICLAISCKKGKPQQPVPSPTKTVRFVLYTNADFSTDNDTVSFKLVIRNNAGTIQSRTIFDSTLATRRFKDLPGPLHKLVFEKTVPDDGSILQAGFIYSAWFGVGSRFDTVGVNEKLKVFEYPFQ
ncbi:hypothetical protein HQ865_03095 [Mucilaginibacter mali]|uniref:Uncharacterized protein n=1 Tax=Mucilaginibacter mali TaxID=2740462 RepID=A0A7D4PZF2_9SPHI|nr:hypothetical protein [Mucilaginibacter mali]QKJ28786.1 hypothetical protein HQ865_03095 [Mucilaginibacter mali]